MQDQRTRSDNQKILISNNTNNIIDDIFEQLSEI